MVERYSTPVQSIRTATATQAPVPYTRDLADSLDADVTEIEAAARQQADAQLLEKENDTLEDKVKDEASNTLFQIQTGLNMLYQEFKSLPEKSHTYTDEKGMAVTMNAQGLRVTLNTSNAKVTIAYAPSRMERILSGTTQKLRIETTFHERLRAGHVWKDDEQPSVRKELLRGAALAGIGTTALYNAYQFITMPNQEPLAVAAGVIGSMAVGVFTYVPMLGYFSSAYDAYVASRHDKKNLNKDRLFTTGSRAVEDAEQTLPLLRVAAEALEEAKERTYAHTYRAQKEVAIKGLIDQERIEAIKQRHAKLKRLLSGNEPTVTPRERTLEQDDELDAVEYSIRRNVQNA